MEIKVYENPNLLWEAADLLCAYINRISPEKLTSGRPYCIPASAVAEMMEQVCGHVNRDDLWVKFYFQGFPVELPSAEGKQTTSLGSLLVRNATIASDCAIRQCREVMHSALIGSGQPYKIFGASAYSFNIDICQEPRPISHELEKLGLPDEMRLRLAEVLSNYHYHVDRICDLLEPLALLLKPLLTPWVDELRPAVDQWRDVLKTEEGLQGFLSRLNINSDWPEQIFVGLHFFYPEISVGNCELGDRIFCMNAGLKLLPLQQEQEQILGHMEMAALRLLSSPDRIKMLRAMSGRVMTQKEIALELEINSGTVFRDLNSLTMTQLVNVVLDGNYRGYTTNLEYLERVTACLNQYIRNGN